MKKNLQHYPTKYNHYHLELRDPGGYILLETDIPFTSRAQLKSTCAAWAKVWNAHSLLVWRGQRVVGYTKRTVSSDHDYRWELKYGPILKAAHQY